jgi:predicted nucleic acid-binding protein
MKTQQIIFYGVYWRMMYNKGINGGCYMTYAIFIDTNIIFNDFYFKSKDLKKLLKYTQKENINIYVTKFNYEEIIKKYRDSIRPIVKSIISNKNDFEKLINEKLVNFEGLKAKKIVDNYKKTLDKILEENNIEIVDYPSDPSLIEKISNKYFNNEKPFDENKASFQDAIVWECIVGYFKDEAPDEIVFISDNHKDFSDKNKKKIHPHLSRDIPDLLYYPSVADYLVNEEEDLKEYFMENFEYDMPSLKSRLEDHLWHNDYLQSAVDDLLLNAEFDFSDLPLTGWGTNGFIDNKDLTLDEVTLDIEENSLLVSFESLLTVSFDVETTNPFHDSEDGGDGMISESNSGEISIRSTISYNLDSEEFTDYYEEDKQFV